MITINDIKNFLNQHNYDVRVSRNGRWIDQKCTSDVMEIISDCILNFVNESPDKTEFMSSDICHADYSVQVIEELFKKPSPIKVEAHNEYDKFFQQPMELLAYSGILDKRKDVNKNIYSVVRKDLLEYIALSARNALSFLIAYIMKVLYDSDLISDFDDFFNNDQTDESYFNIKKIFFDFTKENTPINGDLECGRIFTKVINPLAYDKSKLGTEHGRLSRHRITYDMLMYNRDNFRDIFADKPKEVTRKEYEKELKESGSYNPNPNYYKYESTKAKRQLREFNDTYRDGKSEVQNGIDGSEHATQMHHIFPERRFPQIVMFLENLIALTPTQHMNYAHQDHNTQIISRDFQKICLLAKSDSIKTNLLQEQIEQIYKFSNFITVLSTGLSCDDFSEISDNDFIEIGRQIEVCYSGATL